MFFIGAPKWPGISKLIEEAGEVLQICGKLIGSEGEIKHWNVPDLKSALEDEIGDVLAACHFVIETCGLDFNKIMRRKNQKHGIFHAWHEERINRESSRTT